MESVEDVILDKTPILLKEKGRLADASLRSNLFLQYLSLKSSSYINRKLELLELEFLIHLSMPRWQFLMEL